jgi:hypothetical protein
MTSINLRHIQHLASMFERGIQNAVEGSPRFNYDIPDLQGRHPGPDGVEAYNLGFDFGLRISGRT